MMTKLFAVLWFIISEICWKTNASQISCESFKVQSWFGPIGEVKTCKMDTKTSIKSDEITISPKDGSMKGLRFYDNKKIKFLPVKVSETFPNLLAYSAGSCSLTSINKVNFEGLNNLKVLYLNKNQISTIKSETFEDLVALEELVLVTNKIKSMNGRAFAGLNQLKKVLLNGNVCIDEDFKDETRIATLAQVLDSKCAFIEASAATKAWQTIPSSVLIPTNDPNQECGKIAFLSGLIVGGNQTYRGQWPFLVALHHLEREKFFCGGSLISAQHVLTAAHCIRNKDQVKPLEADEFVALLGRFNLERRFERNSIQITVSEIHIHPDWKYLSEKWDADLAVLVFQLPVKFTNYIQPVCLTGDTRIETQAEGIIVGWGKSESEALHENIPRQVSIKSVNDSICYTTDPLFGKMSSLRTFCAGGNGAGPCHGDSGGGFFVKLGSSWTLRGMVSATVLKDSFDCDIDRYSIFTKVVDFYDWIRNITTGGFNQN